MTNLYDSIGHVTTQYTQGDTNKTWQIYWSGRQTVSQDPAGNRQRYFFDDKTRIIAEQDALGNMSRRFYDGQDHLVMAVSPMNEINQFIFDGNHNLLRQIDPLGFTNRFVYDNRTVVTNGATVTKFVINPNATLSQVLMRIKGGVTNYYVYGLGLLYQITETATATSTLTHHYDYRGSTVALTDDNANITDRIEYSAYATTTYRAGTNDMPFLFNGRYGVMTDDNGLLHMRARYYNPYLCRFINPDPSGFSGGLNFYAYADGNPISYLDPFGLGAREPGGNSWLGNLLSGVPIIGGVLGGVGDLLTGTGNLALGLGTLGFSGTLGTGLNQFGWGVYNTVSGAGTLAGYAWNSPNSAIGLLLGLAGLPFGGDLPTIGHNGIQFPGNPLMGRNGDITFGNVMNFGAPYIDANGNVYPMGPNDPLFPGSPWTYGDHEQQHTYQGMILGPLYHRT